jgi:hypothetical protein
VEEARFNQMAYLGRYGRQPVTQWDDVEIPTFLSHYSSLVELVRAENEKSDDITRMVEDGLAMAEKATIGAELRLDDFASKTLDKVKGGLGVVSGKLAGIKDEALNMAKTAFGTALGFQVSGLLDTLKGVAHEALGKAVDAASAQKGLTMAMAMSQRMGQSYETLQRRAKGVQVELDNLAMATGTTHQEVYELFEYMAEATTKTPSQIQAMTTTMIGAARAIPGGIKEIKSGVDALRSGAVTAANPLVKLISLTGVLQGNAQQVAKKMMWIAPQKQLLLAEEAMKRMAKKMESVPMSFEESVAALGVFKDQMFKTFGQPFLKGLLPVLNNVRNYLVANSGAVEKFAKTMGQKAGEWAAKAGEAILSAFKYLDSNGPAIAETIKEAALTVERVFKYVFAHKDEIATMGKVALAGKAASMVAPGAVGALGGKAVGALGGAVKGGAASAGLAASGASAGVAAASVGAAVAAWAAVAYQAHELYQEVAGSRSEDVQNMESLKEAMMKSATSGDSAAVEELGNRLVKAAQKVDNESANAMAALANSTLRQAMELKAQTTSLMQAADEADVAAGKAGLEGKYLADVYNQAIQVGNMGAARYAADLLINSGRTAETLEQAGVKLEGGFEKFGELFEGAADEVRKKLEGFLKTGEEKKDAKSKYNLNINGSITIKQDFRDQDPDRIASVFTDDLVKAAQSRTSAMTGNPR